MPRKSKNRAVLEANYLLKWTWWTPNFSAQRRQEEDSRDHSRQWYCVGTRADCQLLFQQQGVPLGCLQQTILVLFNAGSCCDETKGQLSATQRSQVWALFVKMDQKISRGPCAQRTWLDCCPASPLCVTGRNFCRFAYEIVLSSPRIASPIQVKRMGHDKLKTALTRLSLLGSGACTWRSLRQ